MTGLELSRGYWREIGTPAFAESCPEVVDRAAVGLAGEGSECFGFDDEISRDHDWGPGFCVWLTPEQAAAFGEKAREVYAALPREYLGFRKLNVIEQTADRVGVHEIGSFFARYTGFDRPPETLREWRMIPESGLAVVTNGEIFQDPTGALTRFRAALLDYYPEELRLKKLAAACALAAQSGQYNFSRCMRRGETVAAMQALGHFLTQGQRIVFLLNRRYTPYYKWTHRALRSLPILGAELAPKFQALVGNLCDREAMIEEISAVVIAELRREGLSDSRSDFLLQHAEEIQRRITAPELQRLPLMAE